jgi:hypothetical protein
MFNLVTHLYREHYGLLYTCVFFFGLAVLELIRRRLSERHTTLFSNLGSPNFSESNLKKPYWAFHGFLWWGHKDAHDPVLTCLCILGCVSELALTILFLLPWLKS